MVAGLKQQIKYLWKRKILQTACNLQLFFKFLGLEMQGHFICKPFDQIGPLRTYQSV